MSAYPAMTDREAINLVFKAVCAFDWVLLEKDPSQEGA